MCPKGVPLSAEHKAKLSVIIKKRYEDPEYRARIADAQRGKKHKPESKEKMAAWHRGRKIPPEVGAKISASNTGRKHTDETRAKMSQSHKGVKRPEIGKKIKEGLDRHYSNQKSKMYGKANPNWRGGKSFEPYCHKFNEIVKDRVRKRFNYSCALCGVTQTIYTFPVHHIDYNKLQGCKNREWMLVPLCRVCHGKTSHNRHAWFNKLSSLYLARKDIHFNVNPFCDICLSEEGG